MTAHTPVPWTVKNGTVFTDDALSDPVARTVASPSFGYGQTRHDEAMANARLIAAAPEMLEALRFVQEHGAVYPEGEAGQRIRAAIAKAEGRAP
jgi:hypothetical protein